jgi:hypothetical protein
MRLTLRTLLAHLDRTLDAEDDAAIAMKLRESEFASNLVARVRASMASGELGAPAWEIAGRGDDANRIGEYLDSVLSAAQVAEVERLCLESDLHLAEIASCHQILTLVLGQPAEVPVSLRHRIYQLDPEKPFREAVKDAIYGAGSPSSTVGSEIGRSATGSHLGSSVVAPPIAPVGLDDSGVWDAPSRLKQSAAFLPGAIGDARFESPRRLSRADLSDYTVRSPRWGAWLAGGLLALLALGATVVFQHWFEGAVDGSRAEGEIIAPEPSALAESRVARKPAESPNGNGSPAADVDVPLAETAPSTEPERIDQQVVDAMADDKKEAAPVLSAEIPAESPDDGVVESRGLATAGVEPLDDMKTDGANVPEVDADPGSPDGSPESADPIVVTSAGSLLLVRDADSPAWFLATEGTAVDPNGELICPPLFRDRLTLSSGIELTMIGPARLRLSSRAGEVPDVRLSYGRFLVNGAASEAQLTIRLGETTSVLTLPDEGSAAAIEVRSLRLPGANPESPQLNRSVIQVWSARGTPRWRSGNLPEVTLETGQMLAVAEGNQVSLEDAPEIPDWLDEPVEAAESLEVLARNGLLELVRGDDSIELSLREAMSFRRVEVGALAARTLLLLGRHDVYFGADGVFNQTRQRAYWPEHFDAVVRAINTGPETAVAVREAIERMDGAQATVIYRMLWMFSNSQLQAGADATLVRALDDPNLTVRVLASENLRRITGNLMNYRPDLDSAVRRSTDIRRWEGRLGRGEIRWVKETGGGTIEAEGDQSPERP